MSEVSKQTKVVGETKKAKVKWQPATLLDSVKGLDKENFAYRWVNKQDAANLRKKQAEGWEVVSALEGDKVEHERPGRIDEGGRLTGSSFEYRDVVLMRMPKELAQARKEYYQEQTDLQLKSVVERTKSDAEAAGGEITGKVQVGQRVIE